MSVSGSSSGAAISSVSSVFSCVGESLERVSKKQKTGTANTLRTLDELIHEVSKTKAMLEGEGGHSVQACEALSQLNQQVKRLGVVKKVQDDHKQLHSAVAKHAKTLEKELKGPVLSGSPGFDSALVNEIIAQHLFRQGKFEVGKTFVKEAGVRLDSSLQEPFQEMYKTLELLTQGNLQPAVQWARSRRAKLCGKEGVPLEFKLHKLQFLRLLKMNNTLEAMRYARDNFAFFTKENMKEIQQLMGCLCYVGQLQASPYASFVESVQLEDVSHDFTSTCCSLLGLSYESPLFTAIAAGIIALPKQMKVASLMQGKAFTTNPIEVDLGPKFQFHPIFACPVSREQSTPENPPMLLTCGHVIAKASMTKLARGGSRFKCPYCPSEQNNSKALEVIF